MSRPPKRGIEHPSPDLPYNSHSLPAGTELHRIHNRRFGPVSFNPGAPVDPEAGNPGSRFAPIMSAGSFVPTLYAGDSVGVAAFETIFHDIDPEEPFRTVSMSQLSSLDYSVLTTTRELVLTSLFQPDLKKLGLARRDLIDCPASQYHLTRPWSEAIHDAPQRSAGLIWTSRQFDEGRACMLYGTGEQAADLELVSSVQIVNDAETLETIRELGERAGISIVHS